MGISLSILHDHPGPCADLHALCHRDPDLGLPVAGPVAGRGGARPGRDAVSTFRLIILPLVMPGIISSLLISLHHLAGRIHHRLLPGGHRTDAVGLYLRRSSGSRRRCPSSWRWARSWCCCRSCLLAIAEYFRRRGIARTGGKDTGGFL